MTDPIQPLIDDAPATNWEEDDYSAGYLQGLIDAQKATGSFALVKLPEPYILDEDELSNFHPGAGPEIWEGSRHEYYIQGDVVVNDLGRTFRAYALRREAAAMLAAAHALETKENAR